MSIDCYIPEDLQMLDESLQDMDKNINQPVMGHPVASEIPCEKWRTLNPEKNPNLLKRACNIYKVLHIHEVERPAMDKECYYTLECLDGARRNPKSD
jgi:hypothetical protein